MPPPPPPPPPPYGGSTDHGGGVATGPPASPRHHHHLYPRGDRDSDDDDDASGDDKPFYSQQENPLEMVGLDPDELLEWAAEAAAAAAAAAGGGGGGGGEADGGGLSERTSTPPLGGAFEAAAAASPGALMADVERGGGGGGRRRAAGPAAAAAAAPPPPGFGAPLRQPSQQQQQPQQQPRAPPAFKALSAALASRDPRGVALALLRPLLPPSTTTSSRASGSGGGPGGGKPRRGGAPARAAAAAAARLSSPLSSFSRLDAAVLKNVAACAGASMADPVMSVVDTHFVGRLGVAELAAMGPNSALFSVLYFLLFTSLAVLCTQAMAAARARGDPAGVGRGFAQAMAAALALSVPVALLLAAFPELALGAFRAPPEAMADARAYCVLRALALPAALTMVVCQAAFRSLLDLRTPLLVVAASTAANLVLDQLLMFGPVARWGVAGCGLATLGSQYVGAALFALCVWRRRRAFGLGEALREAAAAGGGASGGGGEEGGGARIGRRRPAAARGRRWSGAAAAAPAPASPLKPLAAHPRPHAGAVTAVLMEAGGGGGMAGDHPYPATPPHPPSRAAAAAAARPRPPKAAAAPPLVLLLRSLDWRPFAARLAALSARGLLILSTYTSAALVAARHGTAAIAGHQVVQQQQQLQLSVAWSFLHVGQAMVAAAFHAPPAMGGGRAAARRVAGAVIWWGFAWSLGAAAATFAFRGSLPGAFARDEGLLALVRPALPAAALMLALASNSALEGALLGAGDAPYVVRCYPLAVACCLATLWGGDGWLRRAERRRHGAGAAADPSDAAAADWASAAALEGGLLLLDGAAHVARLPLLPRAQELLRQKLAEVAAGSAAKGLRGVWIALAAYYAALLAAFAHRFWVRRAMV